MSSTAFELLKQNEIVRAGAGAGKTYTLTHKVMDIADAHLKQNGRYPRLIVTTFTRKATQELRERLMLLALEERPELAEFVNSRSQLVISTIHGVMDLFLKRYGTHIGVDPGYKIVSGLEASKLARQCVRRLVLDDTEASELLESLSFNNLVSLLRRIAAVFIESPEARPFDEESFAEIFALRARKLANDFKEAARRIQSETDKETWVAMAKEYLKLGAILEEPAKWTENRERFFSLFDEMPVARRSSRGAQAVSEETAALAKSVREAAEEFREPLHDPACWVLFAGQYKRLEALARKFADEFTRAKLERGMLEISDLEHLALLCVRENPAAAESFAREWDHWLIDEYQDTSPFQVELIRALSGVSPSFIVGDPQQSIYLFRGARSDVFEKKEKEILESGGSRRLLTVNRRSRPELLLFLNDFFSRLDPPFQPMEPYLGDDEKKIEIDPSRNVATFFIAGANDSDESEDDAEMNAIVRYIQDLLENGARPEDICVLARTNQTLLETAEWLGKHRLPTHVHAASGYFDRRETRDALALLKFLVNPHDNINTVELLRSPWFKVPDGILAEAGHRRPASIWERLISENSMADEFSAVRRLQEYLQLVSKEGLTGAFQRALIESGFVDLSHMHDVSGRRESNLWKLLSRLRQEEAAQGFNPLAFIANCRQGDFSPDDANAESDAIAAVEPDRINLMTVHASKGLEFKHVILPRLSQRPRLTTHEEFTYDEDARRWAIRLPYGEDRSMTGTLAETHWLERFRVQELREHARVLYVALTRASESVFLSWTLPEANNSWASMVKLDLSPGEHQGESYRYTVVTEFEAPKDVVFDESNKVKPRSPWQAKVTPSGALGLYETSSGESLQTFSVSDLMERKPGILVKPSSERDIKRVVAATSRGTAIHRLMELLKYPSQDRLHKLVSRWFPGQEDEVLEAVNFVRGASEPPLLEIIANGAVEWRFTAVESGLLIEGQIDLWGRTNSGEAWIVDYKTGSPEFKDKAFDQMAIYSLALRKSGSVAPDEKLMIAAVYPFEAKIFVKPAPSIPQVRSLLGL